MILRMVKGIIYFYKQTYWKVIILVCVLLLFGKGLDMDEVFCTFIIVELKCGLVVVYLVIVVLCLDSIIWSDSAVWAVNFAWGWGEMIDTDGYLVWMWAIFVKPSLCTSFVVYLVWWRIWSTVRRWFLGHMELISRAYVLIKWMNCFISYESILILRALGQTQGEAYLVVST